MRVQYIVHLISFTLFATIAPAYYILFDPGADFLIVRLHLARFFYPAINQIFAGLICLLVGYYWARIMEKKTTLTNHVRVPNAARKSAVILWMVSCALIVGVLITTPQGILSALSALQTKANDSLDMQTFLFLMCSVILTLSFSIFVLDYNEHCITTRLSIIVIFVSTIICFSVGSRYRGIICFAAPAYYLYARGKLNIIKLMLIAVISVVLMDLLYQFRATAQGVYSNGNGDHIKTFIAQWSLVDGGAVGIALKTYIEDPEAQALSTIIRWILPSFIVGVKDPVATLQARMVFFGDNSGGVTLGLFPEMYYYFGWVGGSIVLVTLGIIVRSAVRASAKLSWAGIGVFLALTTLLLGSLRNGLVSDLLSYITIFVTLSLARILSSFLPADRRTTTGARLENT